MAGGGAGMAIGRTVFQDPEPAEAARRWPDRPRCPADRVHRGGDPHHRLRHQRHQGRPVGRATAWWSWPGPSCPPTRPEPGWAEQDPVGWWTSVVVACAEARASRPEAFGAVDAVSCSAARQTFVPVTRRGRAARPGLCCGRTAGRWPRPPRLRQLHGGRRGGPTPHRRPPRRRGGGGQDRLDGRPRARPAGRQPTGCSSPRDLVVWRLTGEVVTDATLASPTGLYDADGRTGRGAGRPRRPASCRRWSTPDHVVGTLRAVPAAELGLHPRIPVVVGAGDRPCEVLGAGASVDRPMVSWGTTANVSVPMPVPTRPDPAPAGAVAHPGRRPGAGCSRGGCRPPARSWPGSVAWPASSPTSWPAWPPASPPGARGVVACPGSTGPGPRGGATTPGRRSSGSASAHDAGDLARAVVESVAWEVVRCLAAVTPGAGGPASA